jgi:hypothetical protein
MGLNGTASNTMNDICGIEFNRRSAAGLGGQPQPWVETHGYHHEIAAATRVVLQS